MEKIKNKVCNIFIDDSYRSFNKALNEVNGTTNKNINEIFDNLHFDVYHPEIVPCKFRNDANLIGALYQHIQTFK